MKLQILLILNITFLLVSESHEITKDEINLHYENNSREFGARSRSHMRDLLYLTELTENREHDALILQTLKDLVGIYKSYIKPLEDAYLFNDISHHAVGEGEIFAVPKILFIGPWSTGKSSLINYILGIENTSFSLASGAQPTTSDFTVLNYDDTHKSIEGSVLIMENSFSSLEKFGHKFLEKLENIRIPNQILKKLNFIDTPGIIENRKQQERGYPFADVCQWFVDRSDLVVLVFDPTKLDVGGELEVLFKQLKKHEAKVRIVLNKADTLNSHELLRVYGTLFWSLAPLINTTEPPRIYVGSFWSKLFPAISKEFQWLFIQEETALIQDIQEVMCNRVQNKIAFLRKHAVLVRNHALVVDQYLNALRQQRSIFRDINDVALSIIYTPDEHKIFQKVLAHPDVSKLDLFSRSAYRDFFSIHSMESFSPLSKHCSFLNNCLLDSISYAIFNKLPGILEAFEKAKKVSCQRSSSYQENENLEHEKAKYTKSLNS